MTISKRVISVVLAVMLLATTVCATAVSVFAADTDAQTSSANKKADAAQAIDKEYRYDGNDLGATYTPEATTFKVWSPTATKITLNLYATGSDSEDGAADLGNYELTLGESGVWAVVVPGDLKNKYYTYTITTKTTTTMDTEGTTTNEVQDVYSRATGVDGARSMIVDLDSTDPEGWENDSHVYLAKNTDASIWEIQIKDFSYNENSGVSQANRGKYLAFTETGTTVNGEEGGASTCVDYLKELGITTVHINPFYDFGSVKETGSDDQFNWGYDPVNYNVPEGSFSSNPYDGNVRIKECKQMIQALHNAGIQVVMDVVYNHTYSQDSVFQKTVPDYYYRFTSSGAWSNGSGCGNETATERAMFRNYVVQSCAYWVNEYHVDGFRFDLMGCMDVETFNAIRAELDKTSENILMYGEGWSGGTCTFDSTTCEGTKTLAATQSNIQSLDLRIAEFNDRIRDGIKGSVFSTVGKGFVQGVKSEAKNIVYGARANTVGNNGWKPAAPSQCVSYNSCHDNATLYDRLVNSVYGLSTDYTQRYSDLVEMNKLAGAITATSQGMHFMLAGEEMARTKLGDENSYSSAATLNMLNWENLYTFGDVVSYYKGLMQIRKSFAPFTASTNDYSDNYIFNNSLTASTETVAYTVANDTEGQWSKMAVILNGGLNENTVTLKDDSVTEWVIIANDKSAGVKSLGEVSGSTFTLPASSAIIAVDKASFESAGITSNTSKVTVKCVYDKTGKVISERTLMGTVGTAYETCEDTSIDIAYVVAGVDGATKGVFTEEDQEVTYHYVDYVPEKIKQADFNSDSKINIIDAATLQLSMAKLGAAVDPEKSDLNYDGDVNVLDVTALQMYLARYSVATGTVVVNHYDAEDGTKIADSTTFRGRVGESYTTDTASVLGYSVDADKMPEKATGVVSYGSATVVDYYYNFTGKRTVLHIKFSEETPSEQALSIWAWTASANLTNSGSWPGDVVSSAKDANGWMKHTLSTTDEPYSVILSYGGSPQTQDYDGFTQNELWIVVRGENPVNQGDWLDFYDVNPDENPDAAPLA